MLQALTLKHKIRQLNLGRSSMIDPNQLPSPNVLSPEELSKLLPILDELEQWAKQVKDYALKQAVKKGESPYPGFKLVHGKSKRLIRDEVAVAKLLQKEGFKDEDIFSKKLIGLSDMQALIGKDKFKELIEPNLFKPDGALTLVPVSDERSKFKKPTAEDDFADVDVDE